MAEFLRRFEKLLGLFLWILFFYLIARIEFFLWNLNQYKSKEITDILWAFVVGFRFDISAVFMTLAPAILWSFLPWPPSRHRLWQLGTFWLAVPLTFVFLTMNLVDTEFINFVGRRFSYDALFIVNEVPGKVGGFFITYWALFLTNTLLLALFTWGAWRVLNKKTHQTKEFSGKSQGFYYGLGVFLVIAATVIGLRGGLQKKPMNIVNSHLFSAPILNNLVLNSTFTFYKSYGAESLSHEVYFQDKNEMLSHLNGAIKGPSLLEGRRPQKPQNVVVIILESFSLEYMGKVNGDKGYTPFLDSLAEKSLFFPNAFANARRSIEGVAASLAGIPAMMSEPFISSHFSTNYFVGLGSMLASHQYQTSFFHGGNNGTMYFDTFAKSAGLDKYYGASEYPNAADNDGTWGIFDEPFLQFMKTQLDESKRPFFASVFTLSSHNPYRIPDAHKGQFPKGPIDILESVGYADYSLQKFFEAAAKTDWYQDTLFVITADHTSLGFRSEYDNEISRFRVPILFFHPGYSWPKEIDREQVVQQIDILPSVMDFLNFENKEINYLGRSIFIPGERTATMFVDGRYFLVDKDYYMDGYTGSEMKMFARSDASGIKPLQEPASRKLELEKRLKASIQYFNEGMWDNRLYYPSGN